MKKVLVIGIAMMMVVGLASVAFATAPGTGLTDFRLEFLVGDSSLSNFDTLTVGTSSKAPVTANGTVNAGSSWDNEVGEGSYGTTWAIIAATDVPASSNPESNYNKDVRYCANPVGPIHFYTWDINLYGNTAYSDANNQIKLLAWSPTNSNATSGYNNAAISLFKELSLFQVNSDGSKTLVFNFLSGAVATTSTATTYSTAFTYTSSNIAKSAGSYAGITPIHLQLVEETPEPGSLLAMMSGLIGLVEFGIRRRK